MRGWPAKKIFVLAMLLLWATAGITQIPFLAVKQVSAEPNVPYVLGNWTYVSKPVLPIRINQSQIPVGSDWTYVYHLEAGKTYRVYCYGEWIDYSTEVNKTDYDIFVYDPVGNLESYHTESAGLPEHLGTTVDHPFFVPKQTGDYSFRIVNDARESSGADAATFMIIEHVETDTWYQCSMEGKVDDEPVEKTSWAYEFNTTSSNIQVVVQVPDTLDMYEARIYIMTDPKTELSSILNGLPLAWEGGLYGNVSTIYGGYNLDSDGLRNNNAIDSCEYPGEDMLINFTAPVEGNVLYHLVFIAEHGSGDIKFMVKTDYDSPELTLINEVTRTDPTNQTAINVRVEDQSTIETVTLNYTNDNGSTYQALDMNAAPNKTYTATIPGQPAGTLVNYTVSAKDMSCNIAEISGGYYVKNSVNVTIDLSSYVVEAAETFKVSGSMPIPETNMTVTYAMLNSTILNGTKPDLTLSPEEMMNYTVKSSVITRVVPTDTSGKFSDTYALSSVGDWLVWATWNGTETYFDKSSNYANLTVNKVYIAVTCNVTSNTVTIGDNVTIIGSVSPIVKGVMVTAELSALNSTIKRNGFTNENGTYTIICKPEEMGLWQINVNLPGNASISTAYANSVKFTVTDTFLNQYLMYIIGGAGGAGGVGAVFIIRKRREE